MSSDRLTDKGLGHGRDWSVLPADEGPLEWSIDPEDGIIQGPLDLGSFRGRRLTLVLAEHQYALLTREGRLMGVYLDGAHTLDVGTGDNQIPLDARLIFLAAERTLDVVWNRRDPLAVAGRGGWQLIGGCNLVIERPARFYRTFLDASEAGDPGFVSRLVDQFVRGLVEELIGDIDPAAGIGAVQSRLTGLDREDLQDGLELCGLRCVNLALYTAAPPVETGVEESDRVPVGT